MPANTQRGFPYPLDTDAVGDMHAHVQALAQAVDDMVGAQAAGKVNVTLAASNGTAQAVVFPVGRFSAAPVVTATADNSSVQIFAQVANVTAAGFDVIARHRDSGATVSATVTIHWHAVLI